MPLIYAAIDEPQRHTPVYEAVARLSTDATRGQAEAQAAAIVASVAANGTDAFGEPILEGYARGRGEASGRAWSARLIPVREAMLVSDRALLLMLCAIALLLVIACANVLIVAAAGVAAALIPLIRATRVAPVAVLRG